MRTIQSRLPTPSRSGLSITEIVVVIVCLVMLAMVIVPYVQQTRESQRLISCQNRIRNLAFAIRTEADDNGGRFPPLTKNELPWTAGIMPLLSGTDEILIRFDEQPIEEQDPISVPQLLCPNGQQYDAGKTCYILNGGWGQFRIDDEGLVHEDEPHVVSIDLDGDGEVSDEEQLLIRSSGVVWRPEPVPTSWTQEEIEALDGLSQTIVLSETQNAKTWMSLETFNLAFVVGLDQITWGDAPEQFQVTTKSLGPYAINSSRGGHKGHWPSPGSLHEKGVNVLFADGAFRTINDNIDPLLYLRLMTPGGTAFGEAKIQQYDRQLNNFSKTEFDQPIRPDDTE
jgi:prepilin-type processing-associated H-X9-DG protein